jgi:hypothetical protein
LADGQVRLAWRHLARSLWTSPGIILRKPRRVGVICMLVLATVLPAAAYRRVFSVMSRAVFGLRPGMAFDALE